MKIFLSEQANKFPEHLEYYKKQSVMPYDKGQLIEKVSTIQINSKKNLHDLSTGSLFNYEIFPTNIMKYLTQWTIEKRAMRIEIPSFRKHLFHPSNMYHRKFCLVLE